jgi:hypothetical protein
MLDRLDRDLVELLLAAARGERVLRELAAFNAVQRRRYLILLGEYGLVQTERLAASEHGGYPDEVCVTGITEAGSRLLDDMLRARRSGMIASESFTPS